MPQYPLRVVRRDIQVHRREKRALVLREPLTIGMAIGFPLVIAGSFLGTMRVRAPRPAAAT